MNLARNLVVAYPRPSVSAGWVPWGIGVAIACCVVPAAAGIRLLLQGPLGRAFLISVSVPPLLLFGISLLWRPLYSPPYLYYLCVPAAVVLAAGSAAVSERFRVASRACVLAAMGASVTAYLALPDHWEPDTDQIARSARELAPSGCAVYHDSPWLLLPVSVQAPALVHRLIAREIPPVDSGAGYIAQRDLAPSGPPPAHPAILVIAVPHRSWEEPVDVERRAAELAPGRRVVRRVDARGGSVLLLE